MAKIDALLLEMISRKGSDLHLEQKRKPKIRINGRLTELLQWPVLEEQALAEMMQEILSKNAWSSFKNTGDSDLAYAVEDGTRFRCNYFRHFYGYGAVFRMIPSKLMTLDELGVPEIVKKFVDYQSGLVLITGPTGSGKSSTMAAIIDDINTKYERKIVTIEEPVEFLHKNKKSIIVHREVGEDTKSFSQGLRTALKSDVNIILVGEMRDKETIKLALTAAEMGILIFGTLHTNSAPKTISRIIDVFPQKQKNQIREILANTLKAVISQQLVRSADEKRRWVACEILTKTSALASIIRRGETDRLDSEIQMNRASGMITMDSCLLQLAESGKITDDEAYIKAINKAAFRKSAEDTWEILDVSKPEEEIEQNL